MDMEWIKNIINRIPTGAKVMVVIGHFMGIAIGMFVAGFISKTSMVPAYIVGGLMLSATIFNVAILPKAIWFSSSDIVLTVVGLLIVMPLDSKQIRI